MTKRKDTEEQLSFDFYDEVTDNPTERKFFESEDELLDIVTSAPEKKENDESMILSSPAGTNINAPAGDISLGDMSLDTADDAEKVIASLNGKTQYCDTAIENADYTEKITASPEDNTDTACSFPPDDPCDPPEPPENTTAKETDTAPSEKNLIRAAMAFFASLNVDSCASRVSTALPRIKADAGAFTLFAGRRTPAVHSTMIALVCTDKNKYALRTDTLPRLNDELNAENVIRESLEAELREKEPALCDGALFPETAVWNYRATKNRKYHACLKRIEKLQYSIDHASLPDRMSTEQKASEYYIVTPEGLANASEIPSDWGLVYVKNDLSFHLVREAVIHECQQQELDAFALRVAAASGSDVMFANGISIDESGTVELRKVPKRRRSK